MPQAVKRFKKFVLIEKNCDNWKKFWSLKKIVMIETIVIIEKGYDDWKRL